INTSSGTFGTVSRLSPTPLRNLPASRKPFLSPAGLHICLQSNLGRFPCEIWPFLEPAENKIRHQESPRCCKHATLVVQLQHFGRSGDVQREEAEGAGCSGSQRADDAS